MPDDMAKALDEMSAEELRQLNDDLADAARSGREKARASVRGYLPADLRDRVSDARIDDMLRRVRFDEKPRAAAMIAEQMRSGRS